MSEIPELERRITEALDRIGRGVERLRAQSADAGKSAPAAPRPMTQAAMSPTAADELRALREALETERAANAQLTERVRAVKQRQETNVTQLERRLAVATEQLDLQGLEIQRLKRANAQLVEANQGLARAHELGFADGQAINKSMAAELEALRAARRAEMAEMEEILSELQPLISEESHA